MREIPVLLGFVLAFIALYVSELRIMRLSIIVMDVVVLFGLFILDNIIFGFNVSLPAYFQKIAVTKDEITSNLSVEQAIQHIAAIVVPIVGGVVWEKAWRAGAVPVRGGHCARRACARPTDACTVSAGSSAGLIGEVLGNTPDISGTCASS